MYHWIKNWIGFAAVVLFLTNCANPSLKNKVQNIPKNIEWKYSGLAGLKEAQKNDKRILVGLSGSNS